jgi:hypothetical protein
MPQMKKKKDKKVKGKELNTKSKKNEKRRQAISTRNFFPKEAAPAIRLDHTVDNSDSR